MAYATFTAPTKEALSMTEPVAAVLLAGGLSRRMGSRDKMLIDIGGRSLIQRVIERTLPQVDAMLLNVNGDPTRFLPFGLPIRPDVIEGYAGPLAGILTGMEWVKETLPGVRWLVSLASDTPLVPDDLVSRLLAATSNEDADIGCAQSGETRHPVFGLWPVSLADDLRHALIEEDIRKISLWASRYKLAYALWPGGDADPFFNINTPEDVCHFRHIVTGE
jgi:molybdopterin-guanine dinucleotide biosynthesis protein A